MGEAIGAPGRFGSASVNLVNGSPPAPHSAEAAGAIELREQLNVLYLVIVLVVAAAGITRLYLMHRRERSQLDTIDGFRDSLDKIGWHTTPKRVAARPDIRSRAVARAAMAERTVTRSHRASARPQGSGRNNRLDPARREAAKRRLEARRRGSLRIPG